MTKRFLLRRDRFAALARQLVPSVYAAAPCATILIALLTACAREPVAPVERAHTTSDRRPRAATEPAVAVSTLLDSFSIGDYTVLPRGGYAGGMWYTRSPEKDVYAGTIKNHPTGLVLPVGLPIRVLSEGRLVSRATAAFQTDYCAHSGGWDPNCGVGAFEYSVHGLAPWYEAGTGLSLTWFPTAGYYDRFFGFLPSAEFFSGWVPSAGSLTERELHVRRLGCCYSIPSGSAAWETYEGGLAPWRDPARWRPGRVGGAGRLAPERTAHGWPDGRARGFRGLGCERRPD